MSGRYPSALWSGRRPLLQALLTPLSVLFGMTVAVRRQAYRIGIFRRHDVGVPVIVVGNISVGGTGKTPVVLALVDVLRKAGWRPGVVSRGYGGRTVHPRLVGADDNPDELGDEPVLMAAQVPVAVCRDRPAAARHLLEHTDCDIIVSDDGLQHYALARSIEWVIVDGQRLLGNGRLLPAGPLREPAARLREVDAVLVNGGSLDGAHRFDLHPQALRAVNGSGRSRPLQWLEGRNIHAVAGIGNPWRFFEQLRGLGARVIEHAFADHQPLRPVDLAFDDELPVVMTAKDAVKCRSWAQDDWWVLPVVARLPSPLTAALSDRLPMPVARQTGQGE